MPSHTTLPGLDAETVKGYKAVLCDLDGCLIAGGRALPGAATFVRALADRLWIVSNNSSDTARTLAARLVPLGIDIAEARVLLAGEQAVEHLARTSPDTGLRCLTDAPVRARAEASGFDLAPVRADHVLLGRMAAFNLACLERVVADLTEGARLLVANADRIHPDPAGNPIPETGAWLAAIKACLPDVAYECFGKPSTHLPAEALRRSGAMAEDAVFIGDNPETDGLAADRLGMDFIEIKRFPGPANLAATQTPDPAELARC